VYSLHHVSHPATAAVVKRPNPAMFSGIISIRRLAHRSFATLLLHCSILLAGLPVKEIMGLSFVKSTRLRDGLEPLTGLLLTWQRAVSRIAFLRDISDPSVRAGSGWRT